MVVRATGLRGATWEFRAHVRNLRNGTESVEVVGGRKGDRAIRSFAPDRIFPVTARRTVRRSADAPVDAPSLAEAPQLPLG